VATTPALPNSTQALSTTGGLGTGAVTYSVGDSAGCSVADTTLIMGSEGNCSVTATKAEDGDYLAITSAPLTITIAAPPGAPKDVTAAPASQRITVEWKAPASAGTNPITDYKATASPGGATCTTTEALLCTISGLNNGTAYTITVQAKSDAGRGTDSAGVTATPQPGITITASPAGGGYRLLGVVDGVPAGSTLVAQVKIGTKPWRDELPLITVASDGTFSWRRILPPEGVTVRVRYGTLVSNPLVLSRV
jgi:hypothetical protein